MFLHLYSLSERNVRCRFNGRTIRSRLLNRTFPRGSLIFQIRHLDVNIVFPSPILDLRPLVDVYTTHAGGPSSCWNHQGWRPARLRGSLDLLTRRYIFPFGLILPSPASSLSAAFFPLFAPLLCFSSSLSSCDSLLDVVPLGSKSLSSSTTGFKILHWYSVIV